MAPDEGSARRVKRNMQAYRTRRRADGLRLVQRWVVDTRSAEFRAAIREQSLVLSRDAAENETLDWIESNADPDDWR